MSMSIDWRALLGVGLALAVVGVIWTWRIGAPGAATALSPSTKSETMRAAPFVVGISSLGDLVPRRRHMIASSFSAKVDELIPEGQEVKAGQLVARLNTEEIEEELQEEELKLATLVKEAEVRALSAKRDHAKQLTDFTRAHHEVGLQRLLLAQLVAGSPRAEIADLLLKSTAAGRSAALARDTFVRQEELVQKGIIRPIDLKKAKVDLATANTAQQVADTALAIARHGYPEAQIEAQRLEVKKAENQLKKATAGLAQGSRVANLVKAVAQAQHEAVQARITDRAHRIRAAKLLAPAAGVVVMQSLWTNGGRKKLQVGDEARENAAFMEIADVSAILIKTRVKEADVGRVKVGMPAKIRVASLNKAFDGRLTSLGVLATEMPDLVNREGASKVFEALIETGEHSSAFRPGMTVDVELIEQTIPDALSVPNGAIEGGPEHTHVWLHHPGSAPEKREITTAEHTATRTRIVSGLKAGDDVLLEAPE